MAGLHIVRDHVEGHAGCAVLGGHRNGGGFVLKQLTPQLQRRCLRDHDKQAHKDSSIEIRTHAYIGGKLRSEFHRQIGAVVHEGLVRREPAEAKGEQ